MIYKNAKEWRADNPLRKLRNRLGITQLGLCSALGVNLFCIQFWESGRSFPSAENLKKLEDIGVSKKELEDWKRSNPDE